MYPSGSMVKLAGNVDVGDKARYLAISSLVEISVSGHGVDVIVVSVLAELGRIPRRV